MTSSNGTKHGSLLLAIKAVVLLDMFAVALVLPLMGSYFKEAGITTKGLGYLGSVYNVSQIIGSLFVGGLMSDTCSKRDVLLLSFIGSAVSYLMMGTTHSLPLIFFSRALVGLVKQTFSVATNVINEAFEGEPDARSLELGRLYAMSNACWTVGPSVGSILYKFDKTAPCIAAATIFLLNAAISVVFMPRTGIMAHPPSKARPPGEEGYSPIWAPYFLFRRQFSDLAREPGVLSIIALRILIIFVESSMSSTRLINYYQNRFGIATSQLGFVSTVSNIVGVVIQTLLVNRIISYFGGNGSMILFCLGAIGVFHMVESFCSSYMYFAFCSLLPGQIAGSLMSASIRNLFSSTVPTQHFGKASAVFSMMISVTGIVSPIYGSHVYSLLSTEQYHYKGIISGIHMLVLALGLSFLLPSVIRASKDGKLTPAAVDVVGGGMGDGKHKGAEKDADSDEGSIEDAGADADEDVDADSQVKISGAINASTTADASADTRISVSASAGTVVTNDGLRRRRKKAGSTAAVAAAVGSAAADAAEPVEPSPASIPRVQSTRLRLDD